MARQLEPYQGNPFLEIGRLIAEESYKRERKEIRLEGMVIDLVKTEGEEIIIGEVKKSSRFEKSAKMQLAFYLLRLKELGVEARGELLFPKEKKKVNVVLTPEIENELKTAIRNIKSITSMEVPPSAKKNRFCKKCAYGEFCWS